MPQRLIHPENRNVPAESFAHRRVLLPLQQQYLRRRRQSPARRRKEWLRSFTIQDDLKGSLPLARPNRNPKILQLAFEQRTAQVAFQPVRFRWVEAIVHPGKENRKAFVELQKQ